VPAISDLADWEGRCGRLRRPAARGRQASAGKQARGWGSGLQAPDVTQSRLGQRIAGGALVARGAAVHKARVEPLWHDLDHKGRGFLRYRRNPRRDLRTDPRYRRGSRPLLPDRTFPAEGIPNARLILYEDRTGVPSSTGASAGTTPPFYWRIEPHARPPATRSGFPLSQA
jgi:hypothetical protein